MAFSVKLALRQATGGYIGLIANRCDGCWHGAIDSVNKQMESRSTHRSRRSTTRMKIKFPNVGVVTGAESGPGASATVSAGIEYPEGVYTPVLFSGGTDGTIPNAQQLLSDWVNVSIPDDTTYWIRTFLRCTSGIIHTATSSTPPRITGDACGFAVSGMADHTTSGTITNTASDLMYFPSAIIGNTTDPTVLIIGDSTSYGLHCASTAIGDKGLSSTVGPIWAVGNMSVPGEKVAGYNSSSAQRRSNYDYASVVFTNFGLNDLGLDLITAATLRSRITTLNSNIPAGTKLVLATLTPGHSTTDSCTTLAGQTTGLNDAIAAGVEGARTAYNDSLRDDTFNPGGTDFIDLASVVETDVLGALTLNGGYWQVSPEQSVDCAHWSTTSANTTFPTAFAAAVAAFPSR